MDFDLKKYLVENKITRNSNRIVKEDFESDKKKLEKLKAQVAAIKTQFGVQDGQLPKTGVEGRDEKVKQDYIRMIGNLPKEIKALKAKVEPQPVQKPQQKKEKQDQKKDVGTAD